MRKTLIAGLALAALLAGASNASAQWAPADSATVHPGVMTFTDGAQCTSNFVFTDSSGGVYIGQAAHCSGTGGQTDTDGCLTQSLPNGTPVEVTGASQPGTLVYNSWTAMQQAGETDADTCAYNDFALIKLNAADSRQGQPVGADARRPDRARADDRGARHGLLLRQLLAAPGHHAALAEARQEPRRSGGGWTHLVYTITPGIPGDSGSGFMDAQGRAFGVLSTLQLAPIVASNGRLRPAQGAGLRTRPRRPGRDAGQGHGAVHGIDHRLIAHLHA